MISTLLDCVLNPLNKRQIPLNFAEVITVHPAHCAILFAGPPVRSVRGAQSVPERVPRAGQQVRREREDHQKALRQVIKGLSHEN
jgi:hypothetical protein